MKIFSKKTLNNMVLGSSLLATGGGGTLEGALSIIKRTKNNLKLVSVDDLDSDSLVCTVFGIGGKQNCDPIKASQNALKIFQRILNQKIAAIIPVENGPMAVANAAFIASKLKIPLLDSDIVGLRSSPEVFLETISLFNLKRTPCAISDDKGNSAVLYETENLEKMEQFFRSFAISAGGDAFIAGYPLKASVLKKVVPLDSLTIAEETGQALTQLNSKKINLNQFVKKTDWVLINRGMITKINKDSSKGFATGFYLIKTTNGIFKVIFKNENLIILKGEKLILTCPDSISLLNLDTFEVINNFNDNKKTKVAILAKKAISVWRTKKGKKLFSPKNLGLNYNQKLLS